MWYKGVLFVWRNQMLRRFVIRQARSGTERAVKYALIRAAQRRYQRKRNRVTIPVQIEG